MTHARHTLINVDELLVELATTAPCPDCAGGLGVHIEANGDWTVLAVHNIPCAGQAGTQRQAGLLP